MGETDIRVELAEVSATCHKNEEDISEMKNEIKTLYNSIPTNLHIRYLDSLIGRVFKILPLKEEGSETVDVYISNLLYELTGNKELIAYLNNDSRYEAILSNLQKLISLKENYRAVVFNTIALITQIRDSEME